jgi:hypothetical protein
VPLTRSHDRNISPLQPSLETIYSHNRFTRKNAVDLLIPNMFMPSDSAAGWNYRNINKINISGEIFGDEQSPEEDRAGSTMIRTYDLGILIERGNYRFHRVP